jgi:3-hydroxybutyrate dehydrogenase
VPFRLKPDPAKSPNSSNHNASITNHQLITNHRSQIKNHPMAIAPRRRALVTGATQGLGLAIARRLAAAGCDVVLNGLTDPATAAALQREIETSYNVRTLYDGADLSRPDAIEYMLDEAAQALGGIDIVVNNAVVRHLNPIESFATADWDQDIAVNLSAAFHTIRLTLAGMKERGWGRIVNVSSIYGLVGAANRAGYVTTKTALIGLTRAIALETTGYDITCNAVCPGTSATPVHEASLEAVMRQTGLDRRAGERQLLAGKQPTGRLVAPEGVAALVGFLCTDDARDITGAVLPIDGGWSAA